MTTKLDRIRELKALPVNTAILGHDGTIVGVNDAWMEFAESNGLRLPDFGVGANYLDYCPGGHGGAPGLAKELKGLLAGRRDLVTLVYPCHSPSKQRWYFLIALPLAIQRRAGVAILHVDLTKLLPIPVLARAGKSARSETSASGLFEAIAGSVEKSVSKDLASQLNAMMGGLRSARKSIQPDAGASRAIDRAGLSKRQMEVLRLIGEGKTNAEIAETLFRSPHTVKLHVSAILRQLNLKSCTQAALLASKLPSDGETNHC
jgi:DNA-binding CsgD family transcriptional regulator